MWTERLPSGSDKSSERDRGLKCRGTKYPAVPIAVGGAGLLLALSSVWFYSGGNFLLQRSLWMDEVHTWLLVTDPDTGHALRALADGADYNPPSYYLLARLALLLPGGVTEYRLRLISLSCMVSGLLAVYLLLCRRFSALASATAVMFIAGHTLLIHQSTEIRFYAAWLAAASWLCWLLDTSHWQRSTLRTTLVVLLSAFICTCHYFGIISLTLLLTGCVVVRRDRDLQRICAAAFLTGLVSLVVCWPFLAGQRAALTRPTWVSPATLQASCDYLVAATPATALSMLLVGLAACTALKRTPVSHIARESASAIRTSGLSMAAMPFVLIAFSWLIQSVLVLRYAITGLPGFAPLLAAMISIYGRKTQWLWCAVSVLLAAQTFSQCVDQWQAEEATREELAARTIQLPEESTIVFEDRILWLPLVWRHPELSARCFLADFNDDQMVIDSDLRVVQRDVGRRIAAWYHGYQMRSVASLALSHDFFVVPYQGGTDRDLRYPSEYRSAGCAPGVYRFSRREEMDRLEQRAGDDTDGAQSAAESCQNARILFDNPGS